MITSVASAQKFVRDLMEERLLSSCIPVTETGCWLWIGRTHSRGYGSVSVYGIHKTMQAHRLSYELYNGELIDGMHIHHRCKTPACVNPAHLQQVTPKENIADSNGVSAINSRKTHCPRGHALSGENLYKGKNSRQCKTCRSAASKRYSRKKRAAK